MSTIRIELPAHLRTLSKVRGEVSLQLDGIVTLRKVLDALEAEYPMLRGTIREYGSRQRRAFLRFFAEERDISHQGMDEELPRTVADGEEPLLVVGAVAGG